MVHERMTTHLRRLAQAAEANQVGLFHHVLGEILDISAEDGMHPAQLQILGEGLCREFGMDDALAKQVLSIASTRAYGEIGRRA